MGTLNKWHTATNIQPDIVWWVAFHVSGSIRHIVMGRSAAALSFIMFAGNHIQWEHQSTVWHHPSTRFARNNSPLCSLPCKSMEDIFPAGGKFVQNSEKFPFHSPFVYFLIHLSLPYYFYYLFPYIFWLNF